MKLPNKEELETLYIIWEEGDLTELGKDRLINVLFKVLKIKPKKKFKLKEGVKE